MPLFYRSVVHSAFSFSSTHFSHTSHFGSFLFLYCYFGSANLYALLALFGAARFPRGPRKAWRKISTRAVYIGKAGRKKCISSNSIESISAVLKPAITSEYPVYALRRLPPPLRFFIALYLKEIPATHAHWCICCNVYKCRRLVTLCLSHPSSVPLELETVCMCTVQAGYETDSVARSWCALCQLQLANPNLRKREADRRKEQARPQTGNLKSTFTASNELLNPEQRCWLFIRS